jgi:hypothetical protein
LAEILPNLGNFGGSLTVNGGTTSYSQDVAFLMPA